MVTLTRNPIDVAKLLAEVEDDGSGGVVLFLGRVRNHSNGHKVSGLSYEAFDEMAQAQLLKIEEEARSKWPVRAMSIHHRLGEMQIGDISVAVAVACAHRGEAFTACRFAIDTLKIKVPIWKKEFREDGSFWVEGALPSVAERSTHNSTENKT
jgi:molybdopterin synthase catalytic subunit